MMNIFSHSEVLPFLLGLSSGLLIPFVCWVAVEVMKTWRSRARVVNVSGPWARENVRGLRGGIVTR